MLSAILLSHALYVLLYGDKVLNPFDMELGLQKQ